MAVEPVESPKQGFIRSRARLLLSIAGVLVLLIVLLVWHYSGRESTDDAQVDGHITPVAARVGGAVVRVPVRDNQPVSAGTVLAEIDPKDYQVASDRAAAELADAEAAASAADVGVPMGATTTESNVRTAQAELEKAQGGELAAEHEVDAARANLAAEQAHLKEKQADATKAERDAERFKGLVAKDEISEQQYDAAVAAAEVARAAADASQADVNVALTGVRVAEGRLAQARGAVTQARAGLESARTAPQQMNVIRSRAAAAAAKVQQAKAELQQAQLNHQYATVTAPSTGVISRKTVEPGQVIQAGQPLMLLVDLVNVWVTANFKETQLKKMRVGQRARVSVDALGGRTFDGHVDSISPATGARFSLLPPENASGNYVKVVQRVPVKVVLEAGQDPEHLLRPGMSVTATVFLK